MGCGGNQREIGEINKRKARKARDQRASKGKRLRRWGWSFAKVVVCEGIEV
jgi:hypothetical protein